MESSPQDFSEDLSSDFYKRLRGKLRAWLSKGGKKHKWAEYIALAPDLFHLLCKLSFDPAVPNDLKLKLWGAIGYFISPVDLLPEAVMGPAGLIDDIIAAVLVLDYALNRVDQKIVKKHWAGDGDILQLIAKIIAAAEGLVGKKIVSVLKKWFGKK